jgi:glycosyltransferase involved in cell wall biosynthesis
MRVGWLADKHDPPGGAEFTQAEFKAAAPDGVEVVDWSPNEEPEGCDRYVIHNCQTYSSRPAGVRYVHDLRGGIQGGDNVICCSPAQAEQLGYDDCGFIPPPIDLAALRPNRQQRRHGVRKGACCVGAFLNPGKAGYRVAVWADENEPVDVYGYGPFLPEGPSVNYCGPLEPSQLAQTLWKYERFVYLPTALEPFGRCVVEAWATGCEVITNDLVGARYWIEEAPEKLESAAEDFWEVVLGA